MYRKVRQSQQIHARAGQPDHESRRRVAFPRGEIDTLNPKPLTRNP